MFCGKGEFTGLVVLAAGALAFASFANGPVTESVEFTGGNLPDGWTRNAQSLLSPVYSNSVSHVSMAYAESAPGTQGGVTLYAIDGGGAETQVAALNTSTARAGFDFAEGTAFRAFRIVADGAGLSSFAATWLDARLDAPTGVVVSNNTGSSFMLSWNPVEGAVGYRAIVWTNVLVGASAGTAVWEETFGNMGVSSGTAKFSTQGNNRADHAAEWTECNDEVYLSSNTNHIRLGGASSKVGWIVVPFPDGGCAPGMHLRVCASRYGKDDGQNLDAAFVSSDGTQTNSHVFVLSNEDATFHLSLADLPAGWKIVLVTVPKDGDAQTKDCRVDLGNVAYVTGYDAGMVQMNVVRTVDVLGATTLTLSDLPSVAVRVAVQAVSASAAQDSPLSAEVEVDLANPPPLPVLAVSGELLGTYGYDEGFDSLLSLSSSAWTDGLALPYWQARNGNKSVDKITTSRGMGGKSGKTSGLYAYCGTNQSDTASCSLSVVANSSNGYRFGLAVTNDVYGVLTNFVVRFTARQWTFSSSRSANQSLHFEWLVTNEVVSVGDDVSGWHEVESLRFDALPPGASNDFPTSEDSRRDFATGSIMAVLQATLEGVALRDGEVLMLRWRPNGVSNGEALGIDDLHLECTALVREEGTVITLALAGNSGGR